MLTNAVFSRIVVIILGCIFFLLFVTPSVYAESSYPETVRVLQILHQDEIQALHNYIAYARKARSENYPNIAKLFRAFAASESIHARNFKDLLSDLNVEVEKVPEPQVDVSSTKKNLKEKKICLKKNENRNIEIILMEIWDMRI